MKGENKMKKVIIFISTVTLIIAICFSGCYKSLYQYINDPVPSDEIFVYKSTQEYSTKESLSESITEIETTKPETTTNKNSNSDTTAKPAEQKSAGQTTTKKQSETNAKKDYTRTTATNHETTKAVATTKKETTTKKQTTTEKPFDVSYWVSYAKDYARSVGLEVNSSASDCWDNPISASSKCVNLKRDIQSRINRYSKDEDITQIWVWAEKTSADSYNIYIGYA